MTFYWCSGKMSRCLVLLCFAVFVCKVHSQFCSPPILPPPCPPPCIPPPCEFPIPPCPVTCPQVINPNPYVTTIIDNSVSNALVNALQLLIVSNLIGATVGPTTPINTNLGPLLDSIVCSNPCPIEVVIPEYTACLPSYEIPCAPVTTCGPYYDIIPPCGPIPNCNPYYDLLPPCGPIPTCNPYYDLLPPCGPIPNCNPYYDVIAPCGPITTTGPYFDLLPPCGPYEIISSCCPIIEPYPPPVCGLTEIISPNYFAYTETITPIYNCIDTIPYNGYGEALCPIYGFESIGPNFAGGLTEIIPNYINYPVNEICPPLYPYYGGLAETVVPAVAALNPFGCLNEVIAPCMPLSNIYGPELSPYGPFVPPNCYGGLADISMPLAAEVVIPSAIPAQLTCNFGYSPSSLPCVRVNVEPLPYENCLCNGYGGPIYY